MYPLKLNSVLKDIIWGGYELSEHYGKGQKNQKIAEAWVLTIREDGENTVENGEFSGMPLGKVINNNGHFPLLIKLIDACDKLSVQVHPDDKYAKEHGIDAGKTEMWYIVDAKPGAKLVYGLRKDIDFTDDQFKNAILQGTLEQYLNYVPVKKGDVFFIPAGLVHAIGEGILIAEVQQNSNTTYRLYDYDRIDKSGKKRELHIDKALEVIDKSLPHSENIPRSVEAKAGYENKILAQCDFFTVGLMTFKNSSETFVNNGMTHLLCTKGSGKYVYCGVSYEFSQGDSYLLTNGIDKIEIISDENCEIIYAK